MHVSVAGDIWSDLVFTKTKRAAQFKIKLVAAKIKFLVYDILSCDMTYITAIFAQILA